MKSHTFKELILKYLDMYSNYLQISFTQVCYF